MATVPELPAESINEATRRKLVAVIPALTELTRQVLREAHEYLAADESRWCCGLVLTGLGVDCQCAITALIHVSLQHRPELPCSLAMVYLNRAAAEAGYDSIIDLNDRSNYATVLNAYRAARAMAGDAEAYQ